LAALLRVASGQKKSPAETGDKVGHRTAMEAGWGLLTLSCNQFLSALQVGLKTVFNSKPADAYAVSLFTFNI
jgi:hypothetical protein